MIKIVEDGWEFVMECRGESDHEHYCDRCKAYGKCKQESKLIKICGILEEKNICYICTSAQKVTEEAKVYHSANWKEAQQLIGTRVMYWDDKRFGGSWQYGTLQGILHTGNIYRMEEEDDNGAMITSPIIKNPEQRHLTLTQIKALHPDLEDVILIEEEDNA